MIDLISIFSAAAIGGLLASLLSQPIILGYLLAGIIVGPAGLGLIKEYEQVEIVAELGVTFLLFTLGVEFSLEELNKVKNISLGGGGLQILLTILMTIVVSLGFGWVTSIPQGLFLGELISLSSTAVVIKSLNEQNESATQHGQVMLGILIVQDLALGLMLAILPALNQPLDEIGVAVGIALVKLTLFAIAAFTIGKWVIPQILRLLAQTESREIFILGVVALCLGIAFLTGKIGLSTEMGAFVAGLMISEVEYSDQTLDYVEPLLDVCAAAFFAAIGVLIDPIFLWNNLPIILGLVVFVLVAKFLIVTPLVMLFRYPLKTALIAGLGLAQIGEFSFVLAGEGQKFGLITNDIYLLILGTTAVTLIVTPFILRALPRIFEWAESSKLLKSWLAMVDVPLDASEDLSLENHVVVCGYGRVGSNIVSLLRDCNYPVLVIDQSEERVQKLRDEKIPYIYGSASSLQVLEKAGVSQAKGVAIALSDSMSTRLCVKRALKLSPEIDLVVRANQDKDIELLYQLGAKEVVQPEFEASLELSAHLFSGLQLPSPDISEIRSSRYLALRPERTQAEIAKELQEVTRTMNNKWYPLPANSPLIGMTLGKTYIRNLTGASLMAIKRSSGEQIDYPEPETIIEPDDRLLLIGTSEDLAAFASLAKGEFPLPEEEMSGFWLLVPSNSKIIGKSLGELDFQQNLAISIQTIWRQGKYLRFPDSNTQIQASDRLLLFGKQESLSQVSRLIASDQTVDVISLTL
jgi:CPA2 family monovalent cation:H+ antiporter-2